MLSTITKGELIEFPTPDGFLLHGFLIGGRARTCIISLHGMTSNFYSASRRNTAIAKKLEGKGISVFAINTRGHDLVSSLPYKNPGRWGKIVGTNYERFEDCVYDISGATKALEKMGFGRFVLLGSSTGCLKITYYQYKKSDRRVLGLILLAPGDDYNMNKKRLGKKFDPVVRLCKAMVKKGHGLKTDNEIPFGFGAKRFLSFADLKNIEARLFNYNGSLHEFSAIDVPICAVFGSRDDGAIKPVKTCLETLKAKTHSKFFTYKIIKGAKHSFRGHDEDIADVVSDFASKLQKVK